MKSASFRIFAFLLLCLFALTSCDSSDAPRPTPGGRADSAVATADSVPAVTEHLPSGRFQLPTAHTPAPDLWITLPEGYTVKNVSRLPNDEFFLVREDDPSMRDPEAVTTGFLRIYIGVIPQSGLDAKANAATRPIVIAARPLEQKSWAEDLPGGKGRYYQREITSSDFFSALSLDLSKTPLHLHLYAAGSDSARVSELAASALTIGFAP